MIKTEEKQEVHTGRGKENEGTDEGKGLSSSILFATNKQKTMCEICRLFFNALAIDHDQGKLGQELESDGSLL